MKTKVLNYLKRVNWRDTLLSATLILTASLYFTSTKLAFADSGIFGIFEGMISTVYADFMSTITPAFILAFVISIAGWAVFPNKKVNEACKNGALVIVILYVVLLLVVPLFTYLKSLTGNVSTDISGL